MRYKKFIIENYKGIKGPLEVDVSKVNVLPFIGVNESGKTSILHAILAFDRYNDGSNGSYHITDTENFYYPSESNVCRVTAEIEISTKELQIALNPLSELDQETLEHIHPLMESHSADIDELRDKIKKNSNFTITRNLNTKKYTSSYSCSQEVETFLCKQILQSLPFMLYFDDFRDDISQFIRIPESKDEENQSRWIPYFEELLSAVDITEPIYELRSKSSNPRDAIIRRAQKHLQETLTKHWNNFSVSKSDPLQIELKYHNNHDLEVKVIETITKNGIQEEAFFNIKDRSKGFYWYFNFIMKLEFNPRKRSDDDVETIYLLDEPGSYLHASAQSRLCERLSKISKKGKVIYTTHSPYLLNPTHIPINSVQVVSKKEEGMIVSESIHSTKLERKNAAFQPILHALEFLPINMTYDADNIVLTEGIYDYYVFEMFKKKRKLNFFPCVNAESIQHHISYMIYLGKKYSAIWDKDKDGISAFKSAEKSFGKEESKKWSNYSKGRKSKVILQDLIEGIDIKMIKEALELNSNSKFNKVIAQLFHSNKRKKILNNIQSKTIGNIDHILDEIEAKVKL